MKLLGIIKKILARIGVFIKSGFLYVFSGNILVKASNMIASIIIVRITEKTEYAYYSYAVNLFSYIELIAGLGLASALLKYATNDNSKEKDKAYFVFAGKWGTLIQFIASALLCIGVTFIELPFAEAKTYVYALALLPCLSYFLSVLQMYLRARENYDKYAMTGLGQAVIICVIGSLAAIVFGVKGLVGARYLAVGIVILCAWRYICPQIRRIDNVRLEKEEKRAFVGMGGAMMLADFFSAIMPYNETFLVNNLIKDEIVTANFKVAGLLPSQLILVTGSIVIFFFPKVAKISDERYVLKYIFKIAFFNLIAVSVITFLGILLTPMIINVLYGNKYQDAAEMSYMLWIMRYINVAFRMLPMNFLPALGRTRFNALCCAISCVFQIVIDYFCLSIYGMNGLAYATIVIYVLSGIAFWAYLIKVCKDSGQRRNV